MAGQESAVTLLKNVLARGRHHHAYVFAGPEGVGKTMAARIFARAVLCLSPGDAIPPCEVCDSCRRFCTGTHPDFLCVEPEGKSIGIDAVRGLQRWMSIRPGLGMRRVALVEPGEAMTDVAQNALLKTLEEPPAGTVLIIVCHGAAGLLPTVASRCQHVSFRSVPVPELRCLLESRCPEYRRNSSLIAALSDGRPAVALSRDWEAVLARRDELVRLVARWPTSDPLDALQQAAKWDAGDEATLLEDLDLLQWWMRDLLVLQESADSANELLINADRIDDLRRQSPRWTADRLLAVQDAFSAARRRMRQHVNRRLNLDVLLLQISQP